MTTRETDKRPAPPAGTSPPDDPDTGDVGRVLRRAFKDTVDEPVPDEMLDLLRRLT